MDVDKLLIVAHPDDEILWGGINLLVQPGWFVICATHLNDPVRSKEFFRTMSFANVTKYVMFDSKDEYTEDEDEADAAFLGTPFENALKQLSGKQWKLVLTHNERGEYGHEHHRAIHRLVMKYFPEAKTFNVGQHLKPPAVELKRALLQYYEKTQDICKKIFNKQSHKLKPIERLHFFNEKVYLPVQRKIPRVIHQIWFGKPLDSTTVRYNLMKNVKQMCEKYGFTYKLWTTDDMKFENLPIVWDYIQTAIEVGERLEQSRYAQVADLARYELLHRFGGIYLDSLFEISPEFLKYIDSRADKFELITANEDPCKLKCVGSGGKHYMSNGFFACVPGCIILKRLLDYDKLDEIDFDNVRINQETGPYFFRSAMLSRDKIHVIDTEKIYPFMVNDSKYRKGEPNQCIEDGKLINDCLRRKYPKSLTIYQSGFGGSWSW